MQTQERSQERQSFDAADMRPVVDSFLHQKRDLRRVALNAGVQTGGSVVDGVLLRLVGMAGFTPMALPFLGLWAAHAGIQRVFVQPRFRERVGVIGDKATVEIWNKTARAAQRHRPPKDDRSTDALFDDVSQVSNGWQNHVPFLAMDTLTVAGSVVGAAILGGPILAAALGVTTAVIAIQGRRAMKNVRDVDQSLQEAQEGLRERFRDVAHPHGWDLFRRMGARLFGQQRFGRAVDTHAHAARAARKPRLRAGVWTALAELAFTVGTLAWAVATGNPLLALGPMVMAAQAFGAAVRWPHNLLGISPSLAASKRITKFIREPSAVVERANARDLPRRLSRGIEIEGVTFGYGRGEAILQDATLTLRPGTVTALVGPNGSGKSTLIDLLQRKYDVRSGHIRIDGIDLQDATLDSIDDVIGRGVPQQDHVLTGTLRENLLLAKPNATDAEMRRVCQMTGLDRSLRGLSNGLGLDVPVARESVSGGERQRIALARLLLNPPPVALLDEPTAALDPGSRYSVLAAVLQELRAAGSTVLLSAHNLGVIRQANHVAYLEHGHVVEEGSPHELLNGDTRLARSFTDDIDMPRYESHIERELDEITRAEGLDTAPPFERILS